ncbi:uncharacterized protein J4E84_003719 [Alternaria hordeiaustralica]|uniref:uncharacterized protein n=1 Tax=Alternaria hordeiaustralica TaxID=1187925 RepID=UPI0020C43AE2|nr:uncharacterized protein J4E84_003719 [Alternaria hordeiaustralica]KAI4691425.1 hypothetical protein J4E84_003719 [Alternaria hordeiaustralica]
MPRGLNYINQLSPEYISALVDTVHQHQIDPLRDAIAKHVEFETSLRVHMSHETRQYVIRKAHTSIVICGWDKSKWVGWAFVNASLNPKLREDEEDDGEGQEDEPEDVEEDYFAVDGDGRTCSIRDANVPIWNPRRYWLRIIELRVLRILEEWVLLVRFVEKGVEAWVGIPESKRVDHS